FAHAHAVDLGAVGRAQVDDDEAIPLAADLGVAPADVGVGQDDVALGEAADRYRILADDHTPPVVEDDRAERAPARPLLGAPGDEELARAERGVGLELDGHRPDERVALGAAVLAHGVAELARE